jgi:glycosyltransferase involved in cell wall biosynthesis
MTNKILFITTTSLSTNPRLLKELYLTIKMGVDVEVICFKLGNWSDKTDLEHIKNLGNVKVHFLSAGKKPMLAWLTSTIIWKACNFFYTLLSNNIKINAFAHNKRTWLIGNFLKKNKAQYQLLIAHNLGALFPAWQYSKKHNIPFVFDIEDYHPGESCSPAEKKRREFLMKKLLPKAVYITYASPLISEYSLKLLKENEIPVHFLVNNCFSRKEFELHENNTEKVQLVWFSQNIAAGRGLELVLPVLYKFKDKVQVNLVGNLYQQFYNNFLVQYADMLKIAEPMPQPILNRFICQFDIGLAIELKTADFNREICLTNKLFAYAQAGLYILATDTSAQKQFSSEHKDFVMVSAQNPVEIEKSIVYIIENIDKIRKEKKSRFEYAQNLSWENESQKLVEIWEKI